MDGRELRPGAVIKNYRLRRRLGEGAFGTVWEASRSGPFGDEKDVALKVVDLAALDLNEAQVVALLNEGRNLARVNHPNVVDLYELGCEGRIYFVAMACVRGITFRELLNRVAARGAALPISVVIDLTLGVARGLAAAHSATDGEGRPLHLVHRDVKPGNLMLDTTGTVKVLDFGIARASSNLDRTGGKHVKGTPHYMPPEQWDGGRTITSAADVFALGAVAWELATGRILLDGGNLREVFRRLDAATPEEDVAPLRVRCPSLASILERCLDRDPARRPADGAALVAELERVRGEVAAPADLAFVAGLLGIGGATPNLAVHDRLLRTTADPEWRTFLSASAAVPSREVPTLSGPAPEEDPPPWREGDDPEAPPTVRSPVPLGGRARLPRWTWAAAALALALGAWVGSSLPPLGEKGRRADGASPGDPPPAPAPLPPPSEQEPDRVQGSSPVAPTATRPRKEAPAPGPRTVAAALPAGGRSPRSVESEPEAPPLPAPAPKLLEGGVRGDVRPHGWPTFTVRVEGDAGSCVPVLYVEEPNGLAPPLPARKGTRWAGEIYTFRVEVPPSYPAGIRYRFRCEVGGITVRWPADREWAAAKESLDR